MDPVAWTLKRPSPDEKKEIKRMITRLADNIDALLANPKLKKSHVLRAMAHLETVSEYLS